MTDILGGKVAVIVGGSGGIGASTAKVLAKAGATVVVGYRSNKDKAEALAESLLGSGHKALPVSVMDTASIVMLRDSVHDAFGKVDILINAAGTTKPVPHQDLEGLTDDIIDEVFASNWRGVFATVRAFATMLKASGQGVIVNVSSIAAYKGFDLRSRIVVLRRR